jgi:hypothetical protein
MHYRDPTFHSGHRYVSREAPLTETRCTAPARQSDSFENSTTSSLPPP